MILLARHGQTDFNAPPVRIQGSLDPPLNDLGRAQAEELAQLVAGDGLRAFEIPDRDPVAVSSVVEFDGRIVALWPETGGNAAAAIVKRKDTGWYEAYRVSISCGN